LNLYVLQHGEAVDKQADPERPLSARGEREIRVLAMHMRNMGVHLEKIFHSGKLRAEQSASLVAATLSPGIQPVQAAGLNPNDDPAIIVGDIDRIGENILIASHMPFVSRLCSMLLTGTTDAEFASLPGTLFCLEQSEGKWRLAYMLRPDFL
jgi:phosphohistidine phosphatase